MTGLAVCGVEFGQCKNWGILNAPHCLNFKVRVAISTQSLPVLRSRQRFSQIWSSGLNSLENFLWKSSDVGLGSSSIEAVDEGGHALPQAGFG